MAPVIDPDRFYELVPSGGGTRIGSVEERTEHSLELRDWHLADADLIAKHRPFAVRGGSVNTGPWRVVSTVTPYFTFHVPGGWPEAQEALAIKLAAMLNGDAPAGVGEARPAEPPLNERVAEAREALEGGRESTVDYLVGAPAEEQPDVRAEADMRAEAELRLSYSESGSNMARSARDVMALLAEVARLREQLDAATVQRDDLQLMRADPIGRANVPPEIVSALIDALETARESNRHNFEVARAALGDVAAGADQGSAPSKTEGRAGDKEAL